MPPTCDQLSWSDHRAERTLFIKMSYTRAATWEHLPGSSPRSGAHSLSLGFNALFILPASAPAANKKPRDAAAAEIFKCFMHLLARYNLKAAERCMRVAAHQINMGVT